MPKDPETTPAAMTAYDALTYALAVMLDQENDLEASGAWEGYGEQLEEARAALAALRDALPSIEHLDGAACLLEDILRDPEEDPSLRAIRRLAAALETPEA
jgi:hypothetical protein